MRCFSLRMDTEQQPEQPDEPVEPGPVEEDVEARQRREALADLLEQIELHGRL